MQDGRGDSEEGVECRSTERATVEGMSASMRSVFRIVSSITLSLYFSERAVPSVLPMSFSKPGSL